MQLTSIMSNFVDPEAEKFWNTVISHTLTGGYDGKNPFVFSKTQEDGKPVPRPESTSFLYWSVGEIKLEGKTDWRSQLENTKQSFHALEFDTRYECHIDKIDPDKDPLGHLVNDSPGTLAAAIVGIAAIVGGVSYYFHRKNKEDDEEEEL